MSKNVRHLFLNSVHYRLEQGHEGKEGLGIIFQRPLVSTLSWFYSSIGQMVFTGLHLRGFGQNSFLLSSHIQHFLGPQSSWRCVGGSESERLGSGLCIFRSWWSILQGILWRDALVGLGLFWSEVEGGSPRACSGFFFFSCKEATIWIVDLYIYVYIYMYI